jgi:hypothetical protein
MRLSDEKNRDILLLSTRRKAQGFSSSVGQHFREGKCILL